MTSRASKRAEAFEDTFVFPDRPDSAPKGLTQASKKYKRHATIAMLSLLAFVLAYVALTAWFAWTAYKIFANLGSYDSSLWVMIAGVCSALLAIFITGARRSTPKRPLREPLHRRRPPGHDFPATAQGD